MISRFVLILQFLDYNIQVRVKAGIVESDKAALDPDFFFSLLALINKCWKYIIVGRWGSFLSGKYVRKMGKYKKEQKLLASKVWKIGTFHLLNRKTEF